MTQEPFDFPPPDNLARRTDPDTSAAAAHSLGHRPRIMRERLLGEFAAVPLGLTAEQAAARAGYTAADGAWKRVSDLQNAGLISDTGARSTGLSGRSQVLWAITDEGRRVWRDRK